MKHNHLWKLLLARAMACLGIKVWTSRHSLMLMLAVAVADAASLILPWPVPSIGYVLDLYIVLMLFFQSAIAAGVWMSPQLYIAPVATVILLGGVLITNRIRLLVNVARFLGCYLVLFNLSLYLVDFSISVMSTSLRAEVYDAQARIEGISDRKSLPPVIAKSTAIGTVELELDARDKWVREVRFWGRSYRMYSMMRGSHWKSVAGKATVCFNEERMWLVLFAMCL